MATNEHIVAMAKIIPHCSLAILPGGHGAYIGEITTCNADSNYNSIAVPLIEKFLDEA